MTGSSTNDALILIVDDDVSTAQLLKRMLEHEGYQVALAATGGRALELYEQINPHLILLDVVLPDFDGFEVCSKLQTLPGGPSTPVLMMTSLGEETKFVERAFAVGVFDYINKPVQSQWIILRQRIRRLVNAKKAEQALERERSLLRTLVDSLPDYIFAKDTEGRFLISNLAHAQAGSAKTAEELVGKSAADLFPPEMAARFDADDRVIMQSGEGLINAERHTVDSNGNKRVVLTTKVPLKDAQGHVIGLVGISRDVTERKKMEEMLQQREARFRALLESAPDAMIIVNPAGIIELVNSRTEQLFGYTRDELIGKSVEMLIPEPFHSRHAAHRMSYIADPGVRGMGIGRSLSALRKDSSCFAVEISLSPIETEHGVLVSSAIRDVTERKQMEAALEQERTLLRTLIDNIPDYIYVKDLESRYVVNNLAVARLFGATSTTELVGRTIADFAPPEISARSRSEEQTIIETGQPLINREQPIFDYQGNQLVALTTKVPLRDSTGKIIGILGVSRDITERKQVEQTLAQQREDNQMLEIELEARLRVERELEELNRLKTEFLTTAAHELRTPLTSVRGFSEIMLTRDLSIDRQKNYLKLIYDQSTQLGGIINDLLDLSRLEANRGLSLTLASTNISELLHQVAIPLIESAPKHKFSFEGLPDNLITVGDSTRIAQVAKNLIANAIKYSPNGGMITISSAVIDHDLRVSVRDEGTGMTPAQQAHLFEPFYRADASNTAIGGTGMGLAISKSIIELHGGKIWAESEYGKGTVFHFTLPLKAETMEG